RIIGMAFFVVCPLMLTFMAVADNLVEVLIGEKWLESVGYFRLLCIVGAILPLYSINQNLFLVRGNSRTFLKVNIIKRFVTLVIVTFTVFISVKALVIGQVVAY